MKEQDDDEAYFRVLVVTQVWLWSSAFVDFVISVVLVSSLYRYKEGWKSKYVGYLHPILLAKQ